MWSYSESSKHRPTKNDVSRDAYYFENSTKGRILRIGFPLVVVAVASTFGWYSSAASRTNVVNVQHESSSTSHPEPSKTPTDNSTNKTGASTNLEFKQSTTSSQPSTSTQLKVNSQPIDIPPNGTIRKVIQDSNGTTTVDVSASSSTNGSANNNTSTNLEVNSRSQSDVSIDMSSHDP